MSVHVPEDGFEVPVEGGRLHGHIGGQGPPALLLHGGAAVTDYMDGCVRELNGLFRTIRYQQRGTFLERFGLLWPNWFTDPARPAENPVVHIGAASSTATNASISEHFAAGTLARTLPALRLPVLFVHGELDPLPVAVVQRIDLLRNLRA